MPVGFNLKRKRIHFKPPQGNRLGCTLVAQSPRSQQSQGISFQETQDEWDKKWSSKFPITYALIKDSKDISKNGMEKSAVYYAMMTWSLEIPLTLKMVKKNQNPQISIKFTDSKHDKFFKDNPQVLAFAYYPGTKKQGGIKLNDDYKWSLSGKKTNSYNLVHTLIHEIGHCLGLKHSVGTHSQSSVMYPYYSGKLKLSAYDKMRIVKKYGNRHWDNYQDYKTFGESVFSMITNL